MAFENDEGQECSLYPIIAQDRQAHRPPAGRHSKLKHNRCLKLTEITDLYFRWNFWQ